MCWSRRGPERNIPRELSPALTHSADACRF